MERAPIVCHPVRCGGPPHRIGPRSAGL